MGPANFLTLDDRFRHHLLHTKVDTSFGSAEEQRALSIYLEKTSKSCAKWLCPEFWTVMLPQAAWYHPAIKHCLVSLALTDEGYGDSRSWKTAGFDSRPKMHYYKAVNLLTNSNYTSTTPSLEVMALASIAFCTYDILDLKPESSFIHVEAASNLLVQMKSRTPRYSSDLIRCTAELLAGFPGSSLDENADPMSRNTYFFSVGHARQHLSSCATSIYRCRDRYLEYHRTCPPSHMKFEVSPLCTEDDWFGESKEMLAEYERMFAALEEPVPFTERETLRACYMATRLALDTILHEFGLLSRPFTQEEEDARYKEILDIGIKVAQQREPEGKEDSVLSSGSQSDVKDEASVSGQMSTTDTDLEEEDLSTAPTEHRYLFAWVLQRSKNDILKLEARRLLERYNEPWDGSRLPIMWIGFL